jgi:hypothetical protein
LPSTVRAGAEAGADGVGQARLLGAEIDAAAARAATRIDGIGALNDLDLLQVEDLALLAARVAHAVDEDVVARRLAPDEGPVGQRLAAFARAEGDAGGVAQQVFQRGRRRLGDDLFRDDRHRAGRVQQGRHELGTFRLTLLQLAVDVDRAEISRLLLLIGGDDHAALGRYIGGQGRRGDQHAGGAGGEQKRSERGGAGLGHIEATFWPDFAMRSQ